MAQIAAIREQLYELSSVAKDLAEDPHLDQIPVEDAATLSFINDLTRTIRQTLDTITEKK